MRLLYLAGSVLFAGSAIAGPLDDMQGKWNTGLMTDESGFFQLRQIFEVTGAHCSMKIDGLANHPMGQGGQRMVWEGELAVVGPSSAVPGAWEVDINITHFWRTLLHPSTVQDHNDERICGFNDWVLGTPKEISNRNCDGTTLRPGIAYELIKISPEASLQFGHPKDDDPVGSARPTSLASDNIIPRNGTGGPIDPHPHADLIKGFYRVTSYKATTRGCDEGSLHAIPAPFSHFQLIDNSDVIPSLGGWSFETCTSQAACQSQADQIVFGADFGVHKDIDESHYTGQSNSWSWADRCYAQSILTTSERGADGSMHMTSRFVSGVIDGIQSKDDCTSDNPLFDAQIPRLHCDKMLDLTSERL